MLTPNQHIIDLGTLKIAVPYTFSYVLTNDSDSVLKVNKITAGCDKCTTAYMKNNAIQPRQSEELIVTFTPGSKGMNSKGLSITYNTTERLQLRFKAIVNE